MSEEQKENSKKPVASAPAEASTSPKPAAPAEAEPAPIPAGEMGQLLEKSKIPVKHLGNDACGAEMIDVACADLLRAAEMIRDQGQFDMLLSCAGVDWKDRLESVYHLYSTKTAKTLALKVTAENEHSPSLMPIWHAADWHERESYDLLGIQYDGHTNLTRILMPNDWLGHPLRKDYKVDDPRLVWNER
ncbi:NADH-quinone oxidoreductase subunit C [Vampirovibrio sp.]|uniref:NADH-quinone oxidoreductase subunit C n=1 Tax=Vampirovibrio sp. TaxID=2717857 RepID=UPI0035941261